MIRVALTGGIGSGKSFIANIFEGFGIPVYYADKEAKKLMWRNREVKLKIKSLFGVDVYHRNGRLNRAKLASQIFTDKALLRKINAIVHPAVQADVQTWFSKQSSVYAIEESAIIFEIGGETAFDKIITVAADEALRISRVMKRDGISKKDVLARMKNQLDQSTKIKKSDFVIYNNGNKGLLKQIWDIHQQLCQ